MSGIKQSLDMMRPLSRSRMADLAGSDVNNLPPPRISPRVSQTGSLRGHPSPRVPTPLEERLIRRAVSPLKDALAAILKGTWRSPFDRILM